MVWRKALSSAIHEIRVVYCPRAAQSKGMRAFVESEYAGIKAANPTLPVYVRPVEGIEPFLAVRYDRGVYQRRATSGMGAEDVAAALTQLVETTPVVADGQSLNRAA
ncbi:NADH dehydrogenase ubiquinone 1 alpha subcomplex subunit 2 [Porphyridium purpureum]|uniref:NADH dehydrogenase ubiquinone 1 alpha subcomplex subunit 2 n=1 Tax=Porphyridium purpureum TaxID=35688 RepID=A0A5J4YQP0_PORPP|nr:NADH dehydrogenase ubiquinone 1 alpha subcomplex subunit 2 [Porphyridium purpureum]|eukprot:POR1037..scf236_6